MQQKWRQNSDASTKITEVPPAQISCVRRFGRLSISEQQTVASCLMPSSLQKSRIVKLSDPVTTGVQAGSDERPRLSRGGICCATTNQHKATDSNRQLLRSNTKLLCSPNRSSHSSQLLLLCQEGAHFACTPSYVFEAAASSNPSNLELFFLSGNCPSCGRGQHVE
ncbi:TPA: hypothetical protein ACH3X1_004666 [Trebouxia sp. C0004]